MGLMLRIGARVKSSNFYESYMNKKFIGEIVGQKDNNGNVIAILLLSCGCILEISPTWIKEVTSECEH